MLSTVTFAAKVDYPTGTNPISVTAADFNRDGKIDLATASIGSGTVSVLWNNGNGSFTPQTNFYIDFVPAIVEG